MYQQTNSSVACEFLDLAEKDVPPVQLLTGPRDFLQNPCLIDKSVKCVLLAITKPRAKAASVAEAQTADLRCSQKSAHPELDIHTLVPHRLYARALLNIDCHARRDYILILRSTKSIRFSLCVRNFLFRKRLYSVTMKDMIDKKSQVAEYAFRK
ncbi:hypothetical protein Smp_113780 [Schistosoma mansoni]|uniref:hypothetical protein n=1 Tax=Schistosoma mansoni TaxID=6183 RepID=UPI00019B377E|nr:hypothetical protein Smp_113780 [Schistosoma mansoni]|eukprot:XP_018646848.1 hypothetical protein Smp_113780 [Schistosoma mansoni]